MADDMKRICRWLLTALACLAAGWVFVNEILKPRSHRIIKRPWRW